MMTMLTRTSVGLLSVFAILTGFSPLQNIRAEDIEGNLVKNGSFDERRVGGRAEGAPIGWRASQFGASYGQDLDDPDLNVLELAGEQDVNAYWRSESIQLPGTRNYLFSWKWKRELENGKGIAAIRWYSSSNKEIQSDAFRSSQSDAGYTEESEPVTAPADATYAVITFKFDPQNSGRIWIDQVSLVPMD